MYCFQLLLSVSTCAATVRAVHPPAVHRGGPAAQDQAQQHRAAAGEGRDRQGLTLVHFSAQLERF